MKKLLTVLLALLVLGGVVVSAGCISTPPPSDSITGTWVHDKPGIRTPPMICISNDLTGFLNQKYSIPMTTIDDIGLSDELPEAAGKSIYIVEYGIILFPNGDNTYTVGCDYYYVETFDDCEYYYEPDDYVEFGTINLIAEDFFIYGADGDEVYYRKIS